MVYIDPIFEITGEIVHGKAVGRKMNMPTANISAAEKAPAGVYASTVIVRNKTYKGITNVGNRPTVDESDDITVETYILDFCGEIYGEEVTLRLYKKLRDTKKFSSKEALREQISRDEAEALRILKNI